MPWAIVFELIAVICAGSIAIIGLVQPWNAEAKVDLISLAALIICLLVFSFLLFRQRGALGRADKKAASEATAARHDFLTKLPNRLAADAAFNALLARGAALRNGSLSAKTSDREGVIPFWHGAAYLAIDLDEFKPVNDDCGHAEGDRLLCEIADILRSVVGPGDMVARVGGDEFTVLMTERDVQQARELACSIRDALRSHKFEAGGRRYPVSASMGLVRIAPDDEDPDVIREAADAGCYAAKEAGRDAVFEIASPGADPSRLDVVETHSAGDKEIRLLAHRMLNLGKGMGAKDRMEIRLDLQSEPPTIGQASKHITRLACAAAFIPAEVPLSIVLPPVVGEKDLGTLDRMAGHLTSRRTSDTTMYLEIPRRRGEHSEIEMAVSIIREHKLRIGVVCRTHSLSNIALLSQLDLDELQLHLARAPAGTLEAYALLATTADWSLSVADANNEEKLKAIMQSPINYIGGEFFGKGDSTAATMESLGSPIKFDQTQSSVSARKSA